MKGGWLTLAALVAWTAALVLSGCAPLPTEPAAPEEPPTALPDLTPIDGQAEFTRVAWEALGQHGPPPRIVWHREGCPLNGNPDSYVDPDGECAFGHYTNGDGFVNVAVRGVRASDTSLAHEYAHLLGWRGGDPDREHTGPAFMEGGAVDVARMAMRLAGW